MSQTDKPVSYQPTDGLTYDPDDARYWDAAGLQKEVDAGLRDLPRLPHVLQVLRQLPDPVRPHRPEARRRRPQAHRRRRRDRVDGRLLPVQAVRGAVPVHAPRQARVPARLPEARPSLPGAAGEGAGHPAAGPPAREPRRGRGLARAQLRHGQRHEPRARHRVFMEKARRHPPGQAAARLRARRPSSSGRSGTGVSSRGRTASRRCSSRPATSSTTSPRSGATPSRCSTATRSTSACVKGLQCCGMPAWEHGRPRDAAQAGGEQPRAADAVRRGGRQGAGHQPDLLHDDAARVPGAAARGARPRARRKLAAARAGPLASSSGRSATSRASTPTSSRPRAGPVAYHAPCHLRAQAVGFKGRDLLRKIPGVQPTLVMECCGHDGTYAMKVEGFEQPQGWGRRPSTA